MRIYKTKNYDEMSRKAANIISAQIDFETRISTWSRHRFLANWNL